ncbi:hypothetical protein AWB69_03637 [Caballeronia udeis]|uniref:Uncharacterized protein n=1 Tax=Caballeronia udeis TaxID=1232866 RepID=A0A158H0K6_9BURK|nr:hypothetical protein AWB69_03637 [Caballeronia udeis]
MELLMNSAETSLRSLVDKWIPPNRAAPIRITRFSSARRGRYVRVEVSRPEGPVALFFFRHDDGVWHIFPPEIGRAMLRTDSVLV